MSSLISFMVPQEYGYVVLATTSTFFVGIFHSYLAGSFRKAAAISYPSPYAEASAMSSANPEQKQAMYRFNCAQRAHGNFLEHQSATVTALLIAGLKFPVTAAALGALWSVGRVVYALGYTSASPRNVNGKGRSRGVFYLLPELVLFVLTGVTGFSMIMN